MNQMESGIDAGLGGNVASHLMSGLVGGGAHLLTSGLIHGVAGVGGLVKANLVEVSQAGLAGF